MRRPLCVFCAGTLGLELVCAFCRKRDVLCRLRHFLLPVCCGRWRAVCTKSPAWGYGICPILGAALGLVLTGSTQAKWEKLQTAYDGRSVLLEAEVESTTSSYFPGRVRAVLRVETVDREAASLRVECASLPACSPGDRVKGRFALETPDDTSRLNALADGIALNAAYEKGFALLGQSTSFRARTARLQKRLSAALRQGMASGPAGVLAAMVTGDRTHLSKELRTAYRGAGLSHVLVVSGMHVSILCGDVLGRLLPNRKTTARLYRPPGQGAVQRCAGIAAGGRDGFHALCFARGGGRLAQCAGGLGLRPAGCPDLAGRGRCSDDGGQQLRRL